MTAADRETPEGLPDPSHLIVVEDLALCLAHFGTAPAPHLRCSMWQDDGIACNYTALYFEETTGA